MEERHWIIILYHSIQIHHSSLPHSVNTCSIDSLRLWLTETKYHVIINPQKMTIATMNHVTNPVWQEVPWHLQAKAPGCLRCSPHQTQGQTLRIWEAQAQGLKGEDMEGPWKAPLSTRFWSHAVVPVVFARKWRMRPLSSGRGFYLLRYPG